MNEENNLSVVLYQPEIPQNTGNIVRTCNVTQTNLILVRPLGFSTSERMLKRSGLDYWNDVNIKEIDNLESFLDDQPINFYFFSSKAKKNYTDVKFEKNTILIFGSESKGLPKHFHEKWPDRFITIPMKKNARCLNISNSVAIGIYEVLRQQNFISLSSW